MPLKVINNVVNRYIIHHLLLLICNSHLSIMHRVYVPLIYELRLKSCKRMTTDTFLSRYWYSNSVRPSVRPSVRLSVRNAPVLHENGLTYRHIFFTFYGSSIILFLSASNIFTKFQRGHPPCWGAKYRRGIKISRFLPVSRYLANDTRYRHSYYGRRIGTRMRSMADQ